MPRLSTAEAPVELIEFLLARIAEDEAVAQGAKSEDPWVYETDTGDVVSDGCMGLAYVAGFGTDAGTTAAAMGRHVARWDPLRVWAECAAKREIVGLARTEMAADRRRSRRDAAESFLRLLALPYADHLDYRAAWRA